MAAGRRWLRSAGERSRSSLKGASRQMAESMSEDQLEAILLGQNAEPAHEKAQSVMLIELKVGPKSAGSS